MYGTPIERTSISMVIDTFGHGNSDDEARQAYKAGIRSRCEYGPSKLSLDHVCYRCHEVRRNGGNGNHCDLRRGVGHHIGLETTLNADHPSVVVGYMPDLIR
jgi:hypothetical protein